MDRAHGRRWQGRRPASAGSVADREGMMGAFEKFDLSLIPPAGARERVAQVAQTAQEDRSCATFATCAGSDRAAAEDWQAYFEERAGIAEHDGGLLRADADAQAFECCVMEWLWQHPPPASGPERCAHCGQPIGEPGRDGLPFLTGDGGHNDDDDACAHGADSHGQSQMGIPNGSLLLGGNH